MQGILCARTVGDDVVPAGGSMETPLPVAGPSTLTLATSTPSVQASSDAPTETLTPIPAAVAAPAGMPDTDEVDRLIDLYFRSVHREFIP